MTARMDPIGILEAAYSLEGTDDGWLARVHEAFHPLLDAGFGSAVYAFDAVGEAVAISRPRFLGRMKEFVHEFAPDKARDKKLGTVCAPDKAHVLYKGSPPCSTAGRGTAGIRDILGLRADRELGRGLMFTAGLETYGMPSPFATLITRLASHIGAMLRLRGRFAAAQSPFALEAILTPDGKLSHAVSDAKDAGSRIALRDAAKAIEASRGKLRRTDAGAAVSMWRALVAGRWSLIEHFDHDGKRFMVAHRNLVPAREPSVGALAERERQAVALAACGHSNKLIAYDLGLSISAVSAYLARAGKKLGVDSRVELVRLYRNGLADAPSA